LLFSDINNLPQKQFELVISTIRISDISNSNWRYH